MSDDLRRLARELAQQAGVPIGEDELAPVAAAYQELLQLLDTLESVPLEPEEESAITLDLAAWEAAPEGPVAAREGDAP